MKLFFGAGLMALLLASLVGYDQVADPPEEFGAVAWNRDLDAAKQKSAETGKPILVLFQEVPG